MVNVAMAQQARPTTRPARVRGQLVRIDGKSLIIQRSSPFPGVPQRPITAPAQEVTIATDENTRFRLDGDPCTLEDLEPEMTVDVLPALNAAPLLPARPYRHIPRACLGPSSKWMGQMWSCLSRSRMPNPRR